MNQVLLNSVANNSLQARPQIKVGQTVKVFQKITEGEKQRIQRFEGLVIQVKGDRGVNQTFTVRALVSGVGVEKIFPVHSPSIDRIEIIKQSKVRRAKLYYMRERSGKSARLREVPMDAEVLNQNIDPESIYPDVEPTVVEAPAADTVDTASADTATVDTAAVDSTTEQTPAETTPTPEVATEKATEKATEEAVAETPAPEVAETPEQAETEAAAEAPEEAAEQTAEKVEEKATEATPEVAEEETKTQESAEEAPQEEATEKPAEQEAKEDESKA